jgi:hypothetical protein
MAIIAAARYADLVRITTVAGNAALESARCRPSPIPSCSDSGITRFGSSSTAPTPAA